MAHPPVGSSTTPSRSLASAPSPLLQQALGSLMVNLDDELLRYRQSRTGQGSVASAKGQLKFRTKPSRPSPSLIHLPTPSPSRPPTTAGAQAAASGSSAPRPLPAGGPHATVTQPSVNSATVNHPTGIPAHPLGENALSRYTVPAYPAPRGGSLMPYQAMPEDYLESTEALLGSAPTSAAPPYELAADDYRPSLARQLATPLGIGALLLLLVGSAGLGYLITSPEAVGHLRDHAWVKRLQPTPPANEDESLTETRPAVAPVPTGLQGIGPDLSGQEFGSLDLDRISTLPAGPSSRPNADFPPLGANPGDRPETPASLANRDRPTDPSAVMRAETVAPLPTRPSQPTTAAPSPARPTPAQPSAARPAPSSTTPPTAVVPRSPQVPQVPLRIAPPAANSQPPQPLGNSVPAQAAPATPSSSSPPAPLTSSNSAPVSQPPATSPNYYVVTDYTGNQSLESARGAVGDAYVRDFSGGTKIQMGAFSQESSARNLVQELQQQGIPAQVYSP